MNSVFGIKKNPNFIISFKNMTILVRCGVGGTTTAFSKVQRSVFTTSVIQFKKFPMAGVVNDGH